MEAKELDDGMASGMGSGVAPLPANVIAFIAAVRPATTVPIKIPTASVSATKRAAIAFSRCTHLLWAPPSELTVAAGPDTPLGLSALCAALLSIPLTGSPISKTPVFFSPPPDPSQTPASPEYSTASVRELPSTNAAPEDTLALWPGRWRRFLLLPDP